MSYQMSLLKFLAVGVTVALKVSLMAGVLGSKMSLITPPPLFLLL